MKLSTRLKAGAGAAALCCCVMVTSTACSLGPNDLPSVTGGIGKSYDLTVQFASVMNLPAGADVMMDGLRVGVVKSVDVSPNKDVTVAVQIKAGTHVPADASAIIRQDTLLGDTYLALDHDSTTTAATQFLQSGGTIPASRTTSPPQLEDTMAVLAYFVNGCSIQKVEDAMTRINRVMPNLPDVHTMASVVARDLHDLSQNTVQIDRMLNGATETGAAIDAKNPALAEVFSQKGARYWYLLAKDIVGYVATVLPSIGSIFHGGAWLIPLLDSLANAGGEMRDIYDVTSSDKLTNFLRNTVAPFVKDPSVNIRSVQAANGDQVIGDVENVLRMLGAVK
ncbi:MlaD family protein [Nocardia miyunensis]|uniref:MlaD family protein n=1 Tax=Nocardia miyunensis TaxID=282684 RepID=UPI00082AE8E7|nr:MlaD family protein [Nocardia miyunensis]